MDWPPTDPPDLTIDTAAKVAGYSVAAIRKAVRLGELTYYQRKPGTRLYFRRSEVISWSRGPSRRVRGAA